MNIYVNEKILRFPACPALKNTAPAPAKRHSNFYQKKQHGGTVSSGLHLSLFAANYYLLLEKY